MARYKEYSYEQEILLAVSLKRQILPGTFEYTLNFLIDDMDLSVFDMHYNNDEVGASAYDPAILLKVILYAYSKGIISSRKIEQLCQENVICIALAADSHPHFTTIADFISHREKECVELFKQVLAVCYSENLIGKNMFAIDGCKISSNCSKEWSGTKTELKAKAEKFEKSIELLMRKHREMDAQEKESEVVIKEEDSIAKLKAKAKKIHEWLDNHEERLGSSGTPIKSNIIDNESAKMATSHGVIQGYNGVVAVDEKHQIITWAGVFGDSNESKHLPEILDGLQKNCQEASISKNILKGTKITADTGYHSEDNMKMLFERQIDAYIPDNQFRKRDVRFNDVGKYKKKIAEWQPKRGKKYFEAQDFYYDDGRQTLICPAGKSMWLKTRNFRSQGGRYQGQSYMGHIADCLGCDLRAKCLRKDTTKARQVTIFNKEIESQRINYTSLMKKRIDTEYGRSEYSKRMGTVEPVFGHLAGTKRLNRFTLRGKEKVNAQWIMYCLVHNVGKVQKYGSNRESK